MSSFILVCVGLVLFSGLFYLFPRVRERAVEEDLATSNRAMFRRREAELEAEGAGELTEDAKLRLLEDEAEAAQHAAEQAQGTPAMPLWWLLPFVALFSAALYYKIGSAPDVMINKQLQTVGAESSADEMAALMAAIEQRAAQRPDNLHYAALLGRYYMGREDYHRAAAIYGELAREAPGDAQALAYAAQAEYLASGRELNQRSQMLAEQALSVNPHQRTALGLLGMASFETGQYRAAIEYWQRLLAVEQPGSESAQMIQSVLAMAQERLAGPEAGQADTQASEPVATSETVAAGALTVTVELPEGASPAPSDTVFVLARNPDSGSRMPIAVQRLSASQLPLTLTLDDSNSMAGQKLSTAEVVQVFVQVSPGGQPGEANASWLGESERVTPAEANTPLIIRLRPAS